MCAAADVEQNAVGRIGGEERRVALAPVGQGIKEASVGCLVLRHCSESGMHGACLRQRETGGLARPPPPRPHPREKIESGAPSPHPPGGGGGSPPPHPAGGRQTVP